MRLERFGIIAVIKERTCAEIVEAMKKLREYDSIRSYEIRLDALLEQELAVFMESFQVASYHERIILTLRSKEAGGEREISHEMRYAIWSSLPENLKHLICNGKSRVYVDFEIELFDWMHKAGKHVPFPESHIGVSYHDFAGRAGKHDFLKLLEQMEALPAKAFMKIVGTAKSDADGENIFPLFTRHASSTPLIAFLMGEHGRHTRIYSLLWGGAGVYGYIPGRAPAAPGMYSVDELVKNVDVRNALHL